MEKKEKYQQLLPQLKALTEGVDNNTGVLANAAALMQEMKDDLKLVAQILENMDTESRAAIMDAMDADFAATITKLMAP